MYRNLSLCVCQCTLCCGLLLSAAMMCYGAESGEADLASAMDLTTDLMLSDSQAKRGRDIEMVGALLEGVRGATD